MNTVYIYSIRFFFPPVELTVFIALFFCVCVCRFSKSMCVCVCFFFSPVCIYSLCSLFLCNVLHFFTMYFFGMPLTKVIGCEHVLHVTESFSFAAKLLQFIYHCVCTICMYVRLVIGTIRSTKASSPFCIRICVSARVYGFILQFIFEPN